MTAAEFPFAEDGVVAGDFTQQFRFPIIGTVYPRWSYITAVLVGQYLWDGYSVRPTDDELRVVASYHEEYVQHWYNASYAKHMRNRPFDVDGGANGRILVKYPHGGWGYRRSSWEYGPTFVPEKSAEPADLISVLDREHTIGSGKPMQRWLDWKSAHAEVFSAVAS